VIVVATEDFELYHEVVSELRERDVAFTTTEPGVEFPAGTEIVLTSKGEQITVPEGVDVVYASPDTPRKAIEEALAVLRGASGRTIIGIDPGEQPGIAVLNGEMVVATFRVPPEEVADVVQAEIEDVPEPLVRIGDGARLVGARLIDAIEEVPVELVDETGTTPYLGTGSRGMGDVLAAVNIARVEGEQITERDIEPTTGELQRIKDRSREQSDHNRAIDAELARQVAVGELTVGEALDKHREAE